MAEILISLDNLKRVYDYISANYSKKTDISEVLWIGEEAPTDSRYSFWLDSENTLRVKKAKDGTITWVEVSGSASGSSASAVAVEAVSELEQNVAADEECELVFNWSTTADDTSKGTVSVYVNSTFKFRQSGIEQGNVSIPVHEYLTPGKTNQVKFVIRDIYGTENEVNFSIAVVVITIKSSFKQNTILNLSKYPTQYEFPIKVTGALTKTVHVLLDGVEVEESSIQVPVKDNGTQKHIILPSCEHGVHTLELYATVTIKGKEIPSNRLYYELLWVDDASDEILIASQFRVSEEEHYDQYQLMKIPHFVYDPKTSTSAEVWYEVNGTLEREQPLLLGRTQRTWETYGSVGDAENVFTIIAGTGDRQVRKSFRVYLHKIETVDVEAVSSDLVVCFNADTSYDNDIEETRDVWKSTGEYPNLCAVFNGFNWTTDGWIRVNGSPALNISGGASIEIPYPVFKGHYKDTGGNEVNTDFLIKGGTIEVEFQVSDVTDIDTPFLSCMSGGRGIEITPQRAILRTLGTEVVTYFKEGDNNNSGIIDDKMRISFVVSPHSSESGKSGGIIYIYINGIASGAMTYSSQDSITQEINPVNILITSTNCSVNLFNLRVYRTPLIAGQIMDNWIYDMNNKGEQVNAAKRNDVYDLTDEERPILYEKIVKQVPCMTIIGKLPTYKGDKRVVNIEFKGTEGGLLDFTIEGVQMDVQGTSSQFYPTKNLKYKSSYKTKDASGHEEKVTRPFVMDAGGESVSYALRDGLLGDKVFCLKADYMETSSTHNTATANLANDMYSEYTPPQRKAIELAKSLAENGDETQVCIPRTTIYGRPIVVFHKETEDSERVFLGKYNFNYDKDAEGVFGFYEDDTYEVIECFEFCNNTSNRCLLHQSEYRNKIEAPPGYDGDYMDSNGQIPEWRQDFETRFCYRPESNKKTDYAYLKAVTDWLVSVDQTTVTNKPLSELGLPNYATNSGAVEYLYDENADIVEFMDFNGFQRKAIDIGLGDSSYPYAYETHEVLETDEEGNQIEVIYYALPIDEDGNEIYSFTHDTREYRLSKFKTELEEHFNLHFVLMYYLLIDVAGMIDSGTKNMFWATWGERHEKHQDRETDNSVIWYPIFYDMDTMLGLSNMGKMDIPYNVEYDTKLKVNVSEEDLVKGYYNEKDNQFYNICDSEVFKELITPELGKTYIDIRTEIVYKYTGDRYVESGSIGFAYNGASNVLWNNVKDAYGTELRALYKEKCSEGIFTYKSLIELYEGHGKNWCESVYNEDAEKKHLSPYINGHYGYTEDSTDAMITTYPDFLYIIHGDRKYHRRWWTSNRCNFVNSRYGVNSYMSDYVTMRLYTTGTNLAITPNADFTVTTYSDEYVRIKYGSKTNYKVCEHNKPTKIEAPKDAFNDTETIIYGASRITSIGDISDKYARLIDLSKASRLVEAIIGSDVPGYSNANLDSVNVSSNPMLQKLHVQNCPNLSDTLDVSKCPRIREVLAHNTSIKMLAAPVGGVLEKVTLPSTIQGLTFINHKNLNDFTLAKRNDGKYNLSTLHIENTPIDSLEFIRNSLDNTVDTDGNLKNTLERVRIVGIDWNLDDDEILRRVMMEMKGYTADKEPQDRAVLIGDCRVSRIKDYLREEIDLFFNEAQSVDRLPEFAKRDFRLTVPEGGVIDTFSVRFFDSVSDEPMYSGVPDDRVLLNDIVSYQGKTPVKSPDWAKTYEFSSWGVYVNGVLTSVDLNSYLISEDTDFYAIYRETPITYKVNFYRLDMTTQEHESIPYRTVSLNYSNNETISEIFPNNEEVSNEYSYIFKGWSTNPEATTPEIGVGGIISIKEGSPLTQNYYAIYANSYKYRVTFYDFDRKTVFPVTVGDKTSDTVVYYKGDTIALPGAPTREPTVSEVYTFAGWSIDGANVIDISTISGGDYDIEYIAVYARSPREYNITFLDTDGTTLYVLSFPYGTVPYDIPEPQREFLDFTEWKPKLTAVGGNATYTAQYQPREYPLKGLNWGTAGVTSDILTSFYYVHADETDTGFTLKHLGTKPFSYRKFIIDLKQTLASKGINVGDKTPILKSVKVTGNFKASKAETANTVVNDHTIALWGNIVNADTNGDGSGDNYTINILDRTDGLSGNNTLHPFELNVGEDISRALTSTGEYSIVLGGIRSSIYIFYWYFTNVSFDITYTVE